MKYMQRSESVLVAEIIKPSDLEKLKKRFPKLFTIQKIEKNDEFITLAKLMRQKPKRGGYGI